MTRRASLAEQLAAVRKFITEPDHIPEPIQTNWSTVVTNDNDAEDFSDLKAERLWDISPSPEEIIRNVKRYPEVRNENGQVVAIGRLRFSDGTQTEQGLKLTIDGKLVQHQFRVPTGGMLGTTDKERAQRGGDDNPQELKGTNDYFAGKDTEFRPAGFFRALFSKPVKRKTRSERIGPKTKDAARQWLAEAIANTPAMPAVKKCPDGFPASPSNLAHLFPSMVKVVTGGGGSMAWQDIVSEREERDKFFRWVDELKADDRAALEAARTAKGYADIGVAVGQSEKYAKYNGGGRRALLAANDNLMAAIKKHAA